jgi:sulfopyruvate decarboxylase alpha subunit
MADRGKPDAPGWPAAIHAALKAHQVRQVAYVPDGGHAELLRLVHDDPAMTPVLLTSEQEGVGVLAGAWLGGERGVLLMQSSGVGNCVNMLSLVRLCQLPFLALVTMRGEWGEFNPWQVPMGSMTAQAFQLMGIQVQRAETPDEIGPVLNAACAMTFKGGTPMAVLLGQRLIGAKAFLTPTSF